MSKLIPGNHKHLTLEDRTYIEHSLGEGISFREIYAISAKTLPTFPMRSLKTGYQTPRTGAVLITLTTFASIASGVGKSMPVRRSSSVTSRATPAAAVMFSAVILNGNNADGLIKLLMSATAVTSPGTNALSPLSMITMPSRPIACMRNALPQRGKVSPLRASSFTPLMPSCSLW